MVTLARQACTEKPVRGSWPITTAETSHVTTSARQQGTADFTVRNLLSATKRAIEGGVRRSAAPGPPLFPSVLEGSKRMFSISCIC